VDSGRGGAAASGASIGVLSLPNYVPQTAIGHDLRIRDFYADLDMSELFTDHEDPMRFWELSNDVGDIFDHYLVRK
jgi:hypothetical protein